MGIIKDAKIEDVVSDYIDTETQFDEYHSFIDAELKSSWWGKFIKYILDTHEVSLKNGIVDDRIGGDVPGTLMRSILRVSKMCKLVASTISKYPIDHGCMYFATLMAYLTKAEMYMTDDSNSVRLSRKACLYGFTGLTLACLGKMFSSPSLKDAPSWIKELTIHMVQSVCQSGSTSLYPAIMNNSLEGRIVYHCMTMDYTTSIMSFYVCGTDKDMLPIPELNDNVEFVVPSRMQPQT